MMVTLYRLPQKIYIMDSDHIQKVNETSKMLGIDGGG